MRLFKKKRQDDEIDLIAKKVIEFVKLNGYERVGRAMANMGISEIDKSIHKAVSSRIIKSGKYIREARIYKGIGTVMDYDILDNPNYSLVKTQRAVLIISVGVSIFTLLISGINMYISYQNYTLTKITKQQTPIVENATVKSVHIDTIVYRQSTIPKQK